MGDLLCRLVEIYIYVIFARILFSWFPIAPGGAMAGIYSFLYSATEPVLGPVRRVLPPVGVGGMGIDLSPIVVFLVIRVIVLPAVCSL